MAKKIFYQICVDVHVREVSDINNVSICVLDPAPAGVVLVVVVAVAAAGLEVEPDLATVCQDWKCLDLFVYHI